MWLIFLLSALAFGIIGLILCFIGNKFINLMRKDDELTNNELNKIKNKKENM